MGAPQQQGKVLRIGIIQGGKITEERLISRGETVTIGESAENTFVLPNSDLPRSFPLFVTGSKGYSLTFNDKISGKVSVKGAVLDLDALRGRPETKQEGNKYLFPLTTAMRGKVTLSDVSILFQFVPPPLAPVAGLGSDFYLSWQSRIDWVMTGVFAASLFIHLSLVLYARTLEPPPEPTFQEIPERFVRLLRSEEPPPPPEPEIEAPGDEEEVKKEEEKKPEEPGPEEAVEEKPKEVVPQKSQEELREEARQKVNNRGFLAVIGSKSNQNGPNMGAVADIMDSTAGQDLEKFVAAGASMEKAGTASGLRTGEFGNEPVTAGDGPEIATTDVDVTKKKSSGPKSNISAPQDVVGALDSAKIASALGKYRSQVDNCYTKELNKNPKLGGRLVVTITLLPDGTVMDAAVIENMTGNSGIQRRLQVRIKRWKFPAFEGDISSFNAPFIFTAPS